MWYLACTDNSYLLRRALTQDTWARSGGGTATDFGRERELESSGEPQFLRCPLFESAPHSQHPIRCILHPFPSHPIILPWVLLVISFSLVYGNQGLFRVYCTRRRGTCPALFKIISFYYRMAYGLFHTATKFIRLIV